MSVFLICPSRQRMANSRERGRSDADDIHRSNFAWLDATLGAMLCCASSLFSKKVFHGMIKATGVLPCTDLPARHAMASLAHERVSGSSSEGQSFAPRLPRRRGPISACCGSSSSPGLPRHAVMSNTGMPNASFAAKDCNGFNALASPKFCMYASASLWVDRR